MKQPQHTRFLLLSPILLCILVSGCASLDERLASPDSAVRQEAFREFMSSDNLDGDLVKRAVANISDSASLENLAGNAKNASIRLAALSSVTNQAVIVNIADNDPDVDVRVSAIERIADQGVLKRIARNGTASDGKWTAEIEREKRAFANASAMIADEIRALRAKGDIQGSMNAAKRLGSNRGRRTLDLEKVQIAALRNLSDEETVLFVATNSPLAKVRAAAISKISNEADLATIALLDSNQRIRRVAYKQLADADLIGSVAKKETNADLALELLEKLPNRRTYNKLKRELARANEIIDKSRMDEDEGEFQLNQIGKEKLKNVDLSFEFDSPLVKVATDAELAIVRKAALDKLKTVPYFFRNAAEREIKRRLLGNGMSYKYRIFEWFDHCQPLADEYLVGLAAFAWPENDFPSEIILWGILADAASGSGMQFQSWNLKECLIARCRDRSLLEYLAKHQGSLNYAVGIDSRGYLRNGSKQVCLAGSFGSPNYGHSDYEPLYRVEDPWGLVPGLSSTKDMTGRASNYSCHYNENAVKMRIAVLDKEEADAIAAQKAEEAERIKAAALAEIQAEHSATKLIQTARSNADSDLRIAAIERIDDEAVLEDLATNDDKKEIRAASIRRLEDRDLLLDIIENDLDEEVRDVAFNQLREKHPSRVVVSFVHQLHKAKKVSTEALADALSTFDDSQLLRRLFIEDRSVAPELRVSALARVADSGYIATTAERTDSPEVAKAAIARIADDSVLLDVANGNARTKEEGVLKCALDRLKALSRWVTIASRLHDVAEQKAALEKIQTEKDLLKVVTDAQTPPLVVLLAAQRLKSDEVLGQITERVSEAESAWCVQLDKALDNVQQRISSARIHQTSRAAFESDFKDRVGSSEIEVMGSQMALGTWCLRWKDRLNASIAELDGIAGTIDSIDIPESSVFDKARDRAAELRKELGPLLSDQKKMLGDVEDFERIHKQALQMFGPSIL